MLGRLIDQLYPTHVYSPEDEEHVRTVRARYRLETYTAQSPWGSTLPLFQEEESDLNIINLETSITTHSTPWPEKAFNYRMHPANAVSILSAAKIDFACLANNHTLDFGTEGLVETVWTLKYPPDSSGNSENQDVEKGHHRVAYAGAGETTQEAISPAILELPRSKSQRGAKHGGRPGPLSKQDLDERHNLNESGDGKHLIHIYAATDHPQVWRDVPTFHFIDYSERTKEHLKRLIGKHSFLGQENSANSPSPSLKVFSIHWGPNYRWHPDNAIRSLAHFLIFECDVDIVHGHSSHHVQGIECPAPGKVIIYGCGDFVDDYALNKEFRNDLGALYRVTVREEEIHDQHDKSRKTKKVKPIRLEIFPTKISHFQAQ